MVSGVHEIQNGNLTYRIVYKEKDEFLPVFKDFNQMAERLQQSIEQIEREERNRKELIAGARERKARSFENKIKYMDRSRD